MTVNIIADAVCGASHRICGAPCQDRYAIYTINQVSCVALCDGAGSKEMSHLGAQAAANAVARRLVEDFSELVGAPKAALSDLIANAATVHEIAALTFCRILSSVHTALHIILRHSSLLHAAHAAHHLVGNGVGLCAVYIDGAAVLLRGSVIVKG